MSTLKKIKSNLPEVGGGGCYPSVLRNSTSNYDDTLKGMETFEIYIEEKIPTETIDKVDQL